jgi:hypothetical protein
MQSIKEATADFLDNHRIAVVGVSRAKRGHAANNVYLRLRDRGYEVFAINPSAEQIEGDTCYSDLGSVPGGVDAVVIGTRPETAESVMHDCVELGIQFVWMHRGLGRGSVSEAASAYGREHGVNVIDGGCPLMFDPTADFGHRCLKAILSLTGAVPRNV